MAAKIGRSGHTKCNLVISGELRCTVRENCVTLPAIVLVEAEVNINGSRAALWAVMTDIENAAEILSGVEKIEILERPSNGLVGMRWRETRMYFGSLATVEKQITDAVENEFYKTRAEDSGFVFLSTMSISDGGSDGGLKLMSAHDTQPQGVVATLKSLPMIFFKGVIRKALVKDLNDIKMAVERGE